MKRLLLPLALVLAVSPVVAEVERGPHPGEFKANIRPEVTEVDVDEFQFLANYFHSGPSGAAPFDWCWSQRVTGWADQKRVRGDWVFCARENWMMSDPVSTQIGPDYYVIAGIIRTDVGDIYTMTYRSAAWDGEILEGFGGLTRFFGGTGDFNYALGWTTDRPKEYLPSSWTRSQGAITVIGAGTDDHPWTKFEFPARIPGNIETPGDTDFFVFEIKAGWSFRIGTTLGTLDDSLVAIWGYIEGPPECQCPQPYCYGDWWENDSWWDGEGSSLGPLTAAADCTYYLEVLDWGRDEISHTGTYTLWAEAYPPQ